MADSCYDKGGRSFDAANARIFIRGNIDGGFFYRVFVDAAPKHFLPDGPNLEKVFSKKAGLFLRHGKP